MNRKRMYTPYYCIMAVNIAFGYHIVHLYEDDNNADNDDDTILISTIIMAQLLLVLYNNPNNERKFKIIFSHAYLILARLNNC